MVIAQYQLEGLSLCFITTPLSSFANEGEGVVIHLMLCKFIYVKG